MTCFHPSWLIQSFLDRRDAEARRKNLPFFIHIHQSAFIRAAALSPGARQFPNLSIQITRQLHIENFFLHPRPSASISG
jgi:hypothetical protein